MIIADLYSRLLRAWYRLRNRGVSVICVYNDALKLDRFLRAGLRKQTYPVELLAIDNRQRQHASAGTILNKTVQQARFPYLMFAHQDVELISRRWIEKALRLIPQLDKFGAAGVAGKARIGIIANVFHGSPPVSAGRGSLGPVEVQTLDGCLIIVPKAVCERVPLDESHSGWYLYVANYCLDLARQGYKSYVLPFEIYHESAGPSNPTVYETARQYLLHKHRAFVEVVYTTVGDWKTGP